MLKNKVRKEYNTNIKHACGCVTIVPTLRDKPDNKSKNKCPKCRLAELM